MADLSVLLVSVSNLQYFSKLIVIAAPSQELLPHSRPFGPHFYGSQGLTHYRVGNTTNDY